MPISVAQDDGSDKVTVIVIDVPDAVAAFEGQSAQHFEDEGAELNIVRAAFGTADMTPQLQDVGAGDPGVVLIVGNDTFCISPSKRCRPSRTRDRSR